MLYLRKALCVEYGIEISDSNDYYPLLKSSLDDLCAKLYNGYKSPVIDNITIQTIRMLWDLSLNHKSDVENVLDLRCKIQTKLRKSINMWNLSFPYNSFTTIVGNALTKLAPDNKYVSKFEISFDNGENAKDTYGSDNLTNDEFTEISTKIEDGKINHISLDDADKQYAADITVSQGVQFVEQFNVQKGKLKIKISVENGNVNWHYYLYMTDTNNGRLSMPCLAAFTFSMPYLNGMLLEAAFATSEDMVWMSSKWQDLLTTLRSFGTNIQGTPLSNSTNMLNDFHITNLEGVNVIYAVIMDLGMILVRFLTVTK